MLAINTNANADVPIYMMRMHGDAAVEPASGESTMTLLAALPLAHASAHPIRPGIELVTGFPEP